MSVHEMLHRSIGVLTLILGLATALPTAAQNVQNGSAIFNSICVVCHGNPPVGGPETAPNRPDLIRAAIQRVGAMSFIQLTNAQLADVAAYIAFLQNPGPDPGQPTVPTLNYTDLWFDPSQPGWGINVTQHVSNKIFSLFYLYENPNKPMWISLPDGTWTTPTSYTGDIYRVSGPPPTGAYDTSKVGVVKVGSATFTFTTATTGTLAYTINGVTVTRAITRFAF
ncbi:c-type cytochrome [Usitatibacter palustris]|uniref:Cytochrome c domain-containing protein n=1 Tax=Usitatibacter palustris TaxID=2732487 RepID=A0A6M4H7P4_9PROT|nr:c-type cytochrome [Usitatibacter palustris]QJR14713.1 hypothetical protein DSM104440_01523 [Usitatibacter palustris]